METSSGDAERSKPHPDIFEAALGRLHGKARKEEVVGRRRQSSRCVGVLSGGFPESVLKEAGCVAIYADIADLLRQYDESPLAKNR